MPFWKSGLALGLVLASGVAYATPDPSIRESVAVCDPFNPTNCQQPVGGASPSLQVGSGAAAAGIAPVVAGSASSGVQLKSTAGNLYAAYATCTAACWLMIFNSTAAPANGATTAGTGAGNLEDCVAIAAGQSGGVNYRPGPGEIFSTGIYAAVSSTACATLTLSTVGFVHGDAR